MGSEYEDMNKIREAVAEVLEEEEDEASEKNHIGEPGTSRRMRKEDVIDASERENQLRGIARKEAAQLLHDILGFPRRPGKEPIGSTKGGRRINTFEAAEQEAGTPPTRQ